MKLVVRSADRISGSNSSTEFTVKFGQRVFTPIPDQLTTIALVYASIPIQFITLLHLIMQ